MLSASAGSAALGKSGEGFSIGSELLTGGLKLPDAKTSLDAACSLSKNGGVCGGDRSATEQYYSCAARAFGLPSVIIPCLTFAETNMGNMLTTSSAGARGLTQFMPATAATFATIKIKKYNDQWRKFQDCVPQGEMLRFSISNILTNQLGPNFTPVQIAASAMYLRDQVDSWGARVPRLLANAEGFRRVAGALMASVFVSKARAIAVRVRENQDPFLARPRINLFRRSRSYRERGYQHRGNDENFFQ